MTIEQIKVGYDKFSYVIFDHVSKKAAVVDPAFDVKNILSFISSNNLGLEYIILTHYHYDHTSSTSKILNVYPNAKIVISKSDGEKLDLNIQISIVNNCRLKLGRLTLNIILTPGHTPGGICIIVNNKAILTGDTLFIDDCGRADLPGGSISDLFESLQKIKKLPDILIVYPGHDYGSKTFDKLGEQKKTNKTLLAETLDDFSKIQ